MPSMYSIVRTVSFALRWRNQMAAAARNSRPSMRSASMTVTYALRWLGHSRGIIAARREERFRQFHFAGVLATFCRRWRHYRRAILAQPTNDLSNVGVVSTVNRVRPFVEELNCVKCLHEPANAAFVTCKYVHPPLLCQKCETTVTRCKSCIPTEQFSKTILDFLGNVPRSVNLHLLPVFLNCANCESRLATVQFPFCSHIPLICRFCQFLYNITRCPYCRW